MKILCKKNMAYVGMEIFAYVCMSCLIAVCIVIASDVVLVRVSSMVLICFVLLLVLRAEYRGRKWVVCLDNGVVRFYAKEYNYGAALNWTKKYSFPVAKIEKLLVIKLKPFEGGDNVFESRSFLQNEVLFVIPKTPSYVYYVRDYFQLENRSLFEKKMADSGLLECVDSLESLKVYLKR